MLENLLNDAIDKCPFCLRDLSMGPKSILLVKVPIKDSSNGNFTVGYYRGINFCSNSCRDEWEELY
jgi:hypothetical protein